MKVEIELTPEEFKELFLPGEKQTEFAIKMGEAYFHAVSKVASNTVGKVFKRGKKDES